MTQEQITIWWKDFCCGLIALRMQAHRLCSALEPEYLDSVSEDEYNLMFPE